MWERVGSREQGGLEISAGYNHDESDKNVMQAVLTEAHFTSLSLSPAKIR